LFVLLQKAQPAIWLGNRNPLGLEQQSEAAERGNYPEAKPDGELLKGRSACKNRLRSNCFACDARLALACCHWADPLLDNNPLMQERMLVPSELSRHLSFTKQESILGSFLQKCSK